jgi:hypothetical protein
MRFARRRTGDFEANRNIVDSRFLRHEGILLEEVTRRLVDAGQPFAEHVDASV